MNALWPSRSSNDAGAAKQSSADAVPETDTEIADVGPEAPTRSAPDQPQAPRRPPLQRNQVQPPLPQNPPPPVPSAPPQNTPIFAPPGSGNGGPGGNGPQQGQQPPDSLSLAQLRRIVAEFPKTEPIAYDYVYTDTAPIEQEVDEWFMSNFWQWVRLNAAHRAFGAAWAAKFSGSSTGIPRWNDVDDETQARFVRQILASVAGNAADLGADGGDPKSRSEAIATLLYLVLGRWADTVTGATVPDISDPRVKSVATQAQLEAMKAGVLLFSECDGISIVWKVLRELYDSFWDNGVPQVPHNLQILAEELINLMTILYITMQEALDDPIGMGSVLSKLRALDPSLVEFWFHAVATKSRWDETGAIPQTQVFLLFWKSILVVFGGTNEIIETKKDTSEDLDDAKEKDIITASPLDYHVFRQEITSKYPAYIPPQPKIPLEAENTSLLPQLPHQLRHNVANGIYPPATNPSGGASILHQPVHIATPAPSPPPSPGVGGKGGKKQNYQTNQNFPFMYPPLDATSNSAGGKGGAGLQDVLVGRKWEGSDIPASILEAGELFSKRVRMTRASRQLWEERERFLKFDRGWDAEDDDIIDELDLSDLTLEEKEELGLVKKSKFDRTDVAEPEVDYGPGEVNPRTKDRLDAVEKFYKDALPHLQSMVIVLSRAIVHGSNWNLNAPNGQQAGPSNPRVNGAPGPGRPQEGPGINGVEKGEATSPTDEEIEDLRSKEIASKAITGSLILLLKWLKLSHVLKFEFLTQLLLDAGYMTFVLKIFAMHDVQQVVESKTDRIESSFFYFCGSRAGAIPTTQVATTEFEDDSEDDAAPPPIKRRRSPAQPSLPQDGENPGAVAEDGSSAARPEVDELGYPINPLPKEPITDFSRRNFFSLINHLRVMQKICKYKAHRNLLLVHYKSSTILRKALKVPQQELRLYTLKLFKNQVPYCGRKWRQSNMRVITAVYLHCRPELRDEWLAGSDVDAEVEEALPLEQALRSLTHWFNVRRYPDRMSPEVRASLREEQDFFVRELEKMDLNWAEIEGDDASVSLQWEQEGWG